MQRIFLLPGAALSALAATALVKPGTADASVEAAKAGAQQGDEIARAQLKDAISKNLTIYKQGDDAYAFSLERGGDGVVVAEHYSHYSHSSHSSHYSSRY